jgi:hypothetical protein
VCRHGRITTVQVVDLCLQSIQGFPQFIVLASHTRGSRFLSVGCSMQSRSNTTTIRSHFRRSANPIVPTSAAPVQLAKVYCTICSLRRGTPLDCVLDAPVVPQSCVAGVLGWGHVNRPRTKDPIPKMLRMTPNRMNEKGSPSGLMTSASRIASTITTITAAVLRILILPSGIWF